MSVKMLLMWNARMMIDGGDESILATSLLEASNLIVLKVTMLVFLFLIVDSNFDYFLLNEVSEISTIHAYALLLYLVGGLIVEIRG